MTLHLDCLQRICSRMTLIIRWLKLVSRLGVSENVWIHTLIRSIFAPPTALKDTNYCNILIRKESHTNYNSARTLVYTIYRAIKKSERQQSATKPLRAWNALVIDIKLECTIKSLCLDVFVYVSVCSCVWKERRTELHYEIKSQVMIFFALIHKHNTRLGWTTTKFASSASHLFV